MKSDAELMTKCTYCGSKVKIANLEKHCQHVHPDKKPPLNPRVIRARKPTMKGSRYQIVVCEYCGLHLLKRHLKSHIEEQHITHEGKLHNITRVSLDGGINLNELSPEFRELMQQKYAVDEQGFLIPLKDYKIQSSKNDESETNITNL
jgi:DNA-directed RNA polymerase subunit RPC12/RpoP